VRRFKAEKGSVYVRRFKAEKGFSFENIAGATCRRLGRTLGSKVVPCNARQFPACFVSSCVGDPSQRGCKRLQSARAAVRDVVHLLKEAKLRELT
jgi:hypothetical protein